MSRGEKHKLEYDIGFSLLEVLIALFVLSFSLLILVNFTTGAWRRAYDAYFTALAVTVAGNRVEAAYARDSQIYDDDWQRLIANVLPHGQGSCLTTEAGFKVKVSWQQLWQKYKIKYEVGA